MASRNEGSPMFNAWFCYERNFAHEWKPKLYLESPPQLRRMEGTKSAERSPVIKLGDEAGMTAYPDSLNELVARYPPPKDKE